MTDDDDHGGDDFVFYKSKNEGNAKKIKHSEQSLELKPAAPDLEPETKETSPQHSSPETPETEPQTQQDDTSQGDDFALDIPTETTTTAPQTVTGKVVFKSQHDESAEVKDEPEDNGDIETEAETESEAEIEAEADPPPIPGTNEPDTNSDEGFLEELEAIIQAEKAEHSEQTKHNLAPEIEHEPTPELESEVQIQLDSETPLPQDDILEETQELEPEPEAIPEPELEPEPKAEIEIEPEIQPEPIEAEEPPQTQKPKLAALNKDYLERTRTVNKSYSSFIRNVKYALPILAAILIILTFSWNKFEDDQITPISEEEIQPEMRQEVGKNELLNPRFESVDSKGRPFSITAEKVIQENGEKGEMLLQKPSGTMALDDEITLTLTSDQGAYNQIEQYLDLENNVNLTHSDGYRLQTRMMHVDLESNTAWSDEDVTFTAPEGTIDAKGITASSEEKKVIFKGPATMIVDTKKSNLGFGNLLP